jgi:hypothetical protein
VDKRNKELPLLKTKDYEKGNLPESETMHYLKGLKGKGKAIPLQAWTGPEASRRLRLPEFKTLGT